MGISPWFPRAHLPAAAPSHPQTRRALREAVHSRADTLREGGPGAVPDVAGPVQPDTTDSTAPGRTSTLQRLLQDAPAAPATEPTTESATESATEKALRSVTNDPIAPVVASLATT